jgi:hypothetical protein
VDDPPILSAPAVEGKRVVIAGRNSSGPTPIEFRPRFTEALGAQCPAGHRPAVWVTRDDQLGLFPGGNQPQLAAITFSSG